MTTFLDRTGDFTKKKYLYKFYKNGFTSKSPKYMGAGQYMGYETELLSGELIGRAFVGGSIDQQYMFINANGDSEVGLNIRYRLATDPRRKMDIKGLRAQFQHSYYAGSYFGVPSYDIKFFDYMIRWTNSGNTLKAFYKNTELASVTMTAGYSYIRMREVAGVFYIDRSSDGATWTNWTSQAIDFDTDITKSQLSIEADLTDAGGMSMGVVSLSDVEITDANGQLLAVEANALSDLEYTDTINNPASSTSIVFPYNPLNPPAHCEEGNFVEIYANFYDDGAMSIEPILDEDSEPILDEDSEPIRGIFLRGNVPEQTNLLKFSGYISAIDRDYDNETMTLTFVSHGEIASNSIIRGAEIGVEVLSQSQSNSTVISVDRRQTFKVSRMMKVDSAVLRISHGSGGVTRVTIGTGNRVIADSRLIRWSGSLGEMDMQYDFANPVYLEAGVTYWIQETGGFNVTMRYNTTAIPEIQGTRQLYSDGSWSNISGTLYMKLITRQPELNLRLIGTSDKVAKDIFDMSILLDYSPLYIEEVQPTDYPIDIGLNIDSAKNALNALHRQLPTGWFYHVDLGTSAVRIKNRNDTPDHLLVFGRDFTSMKLTTDIDDIVNDVYYVGGTLVENGPKLTTHLFDNESISDYRLGTNIISNDKVTRYDTAQLLSQNVIDNGNTPRITTEITLSASKYNTEAVRIGDVVKIANGDQRVLSIPLVVANIDYAPEEITISLDSAPRNISRTIDQLKRQLENMQTADAGAVL